MALTSEELLHRLIEDLVSVRTRVKTLEEADASTRLDTLTTRIGTLTEQIAHLQPPEDNDSPTPGEVPDWTTMTQDQTRAAWTWLIDWCATVLHPMYATDIWRPCWYEHPRLRMELTWLAAHWDWSRTRKAPPTRTAEWHARWWPHVEQVMRRELAKCGHPTEILREPLHPVAPEANPTEFVDSTASLQEYVNLHVKRRPVKEDEAER
ncbi:hypothetical protein SRB5_53510 [Streptomyces sp. RB5]|uniref:DUF4913 domain-containing protein n=1 Tax=Streptomyces smaragdinus TaxID=2585196 RepID=A0A7K0CPD7_9ACTN|nr:hypothetical protein [Streptomyces smaragdinus]MQY15173.1 hypothetical protein [Streptomyces smaragdinus]